jgi:hypothetical protein
VQRTVNMTHKKRTAMASYFNNKKTAGSTENQARLSCFYYNLLHFC